MCGDSGIMPDIRSFVSLQFALSPMCVFARRIEHPLDMPVQRSHHTDPRHHGRAVLFRH
jgi:hypothetical protein